LLELCAGNFGALVVAIEVGEGSTERPLSFRKTPLRLPHPPPHTADVCHAFGKPHGFEQLLRLVCLDFCLDEFGHLEVHYGPVLAGVALGHCPLALDAAADTLIEPCSGLLPVSLRQRDLSQMVIHQRYAVLVANTPCDG